MNTASIVLPDQLSLENEVIKNSKKYDFLVFFEPVNYLYEFKHHKHKLVLLISSIRHLYKSTKHPQSTLITIAEGGSHKMTELLSNFITSNNIGSISMTHPSDHQTLMDITLLASKLKIELNIHDDKKFIGNHDDFKQWSLNKKTLVMEYFYRWMRKKYDVFMDDGKPIGDKWNFDKENRNSISKLKSDIPQRNIIQKDTITKQVIKDIDLYFPKNIGDSKTFNWAVTHQDAEQQFNFFLDHCFENFGSFQDAIDQKNQFLFHSLLSGYFNIGTLDPTKCIEQTEIRFRQSNLIPINSVEGFIRQLIGWREFIRGVYWANMPKYKTLNFWDHNLKMKDSWYTGSTGIPPLDDAIKHSNETAYTHHINRLMIISNLMNLSRINPGSINNWFMEMYIDAYDWVMVPNVYGMGTFADGGIFSTKPYICGSSYMLRMSNYKKGEWCDTVDGLYWLFIKNNLDFFKSNPRLSLMVNALKKIDSQRKSIIFSKAELFIENNTE